MRINSKGQVTIPAELRHQHRLHPGDEIEVVDRDGVLQIVRASQGTTRGERLVARMRGQAKGGLSTDEIMALTRDD